MTASPAHIPPPGNTALPPEAQRQITALARRQAEARGVLMSLVSAAGDRVETGLRQLPAPIRARIEDSARAALRHSYHLAARSHGIAPLARVMRSDRAHRVAASLSGAVGGAGGAITALAEIPMATTMIFRAVQSVAAAHGEDPRDAQTRIECLRVFGTGAPDPADDGIDTAFLGARLTLTGPALHGVLAQVAPRFATMLGQKLAGQAVPVLGAAAGAGTNYAFTAYYTEIAHVHFGLRALARAHGEAPVLDHFHTETARLSPPVWRASGQK